MKILVLNQYAGSPEMGMAFRVYYMAKEWIKIGHDVRIVAADYTHLRIKNPTVQTDFQKEIIDGITYYWIKTCPYHGNGVKRAISMFLFAGKLFFKQDCLLKVWRPDVVIDATTGHLDTFAAQRICRRTGAKLIHEVRDMWPITLMELGHMSRRNPFVWVVQRAENSFCKHADYVISVLPYAKEYLMKHGMKEEKFHVSSNGIVEEEWLSTQELPKEHQTVFDRLRQEGRFIFCFFGSHTESYAISYLIRAVQALGNSKIAVVLVGNGNQKEQLQKLADKKMGQCFCFLPPVPKTAIPALLKEADALYVGALNSDMFRFGICMNKLFDSMMAGKPILYAVNAPNNYIEQYHCGVSVEPESVEALQKGIETLMAMSPEERGTLGDNGRQAVMEHFTYQKLAADFAALF